MRDEGIWVSEHQEELEPFCGKWIAVLDDAVIASGRTVSEVMEKAEKVTSQLPLVIKVPRKDEAPYAF